MLSVFAAACSAVDGAVPTTAAAATPSPTTPATAPEPATTTALRSETAETVTLDVQGGTRSYELFIPGGFPDVPAALVLDLHGALGTPEMQDRLSGMKAKAAEEGFIVAQPVGVLRSWDIITGDGDDVAFLRAVVADVAARTAIDSDRVFATGMSNGGGMAERLGCVSGDLFAAIAPVAGWYVAAVECTGQGPPVMAFHGTADFVVPYNGDGPLFVPVEEWAAEWAERNGCIDAPEESRLAADVVERTWPGCDRDVSLVIVEGGGHGWPGTSDETFGLASSDSIDATDLIWSFFEAHPRR